MRKKILSLITSEIEDTPKQEDNKNPAAIALGKLGGFKGGKVRAKSFTARQRSEIAKKAGEKQWGKE